MKHIESYELFNKLQFAYENGLNVIIEGKHGVGKTSIIQNVIENNRLKHNLEYVSFSAATMDPWIDFLGIPRMAESNGEPVIKLVKPEYINPNQIKVLFFDEFNRSPKRVRNAVMELIQFKSVNGIKFPKLQCIWAAINPEDSLDTYDVEKIDPAQMDRFHLQYKIKDNICLEFFTKKYGSEKAYNISEWYGSLDKKEKDKISPRRVEYAIDVMNNGGDPSDVLPSSIDISEFKDSISSFTLKTRLTQAALKNDINTVKYLLSDFDSIMTSIGKTNNEIILNVCVGVMNEEQLASCFMQYENIRIWAESRVEELCDDGKISLKQISKEIKRPDDVQKKIISCLANICTINNNKAASNWAENIIKICVPGYKIIANKEMTSKEFEYQCSKRYENINFRVQEWYNKHPNIKSMSKWTEWANLSFHESNEPVDISESNEMLSILESAIKNRRIRNAIEKDASMKNLSAKAAQMINYSMHKNPGIIKDRSYGLILKGEEVQVGPYMNIYKYLIIPEVEKHGCAHNIKLNEKAQIYSFIK